MPAAHSPCVQKRFTGYGVAGMKDIYFQRYPRSTSLCSAVESLYPYKKSRHCVLLFFCAVSATILIIPPNLPLEREASGRAVGRYFIFKGIPASSRCARRPSLLSAQKKEQFVDCSFFAVTAMISTFPPNIPLPRGGFFGRAKIRSPR